jgi:hypothetical protein
MSRWVSGQWGVVWTAGNAAQAAHMVADAAAHSVWLIMWGTAGQQQRQHTVTAQAAASTLAAPGLQP